MSNPLEDYAAKCWDEAHEIIEGERVECSSCLDGFDPQTELGGLQGEFMKFCPKCGALVEPDGRFCVGCGERLR